MIDEFKRFSENAIGWAQTRIGSTRYPLRCLAFVEDAYEQSNSIEMFGGSCARESADEYAASQHGEPIPPVGAFVFYDCWGSLKGEYKNWGHVGLSVGEGQVIHAWDEVRQDDYLAVQRLTPAAGWSPPQYIGWACVERVLRGYRPRVGGDEPADAVNDAAQHGDPTTQ